MPWRRIFGRDAMQFTTLVLTVNTALATLQPQPDVPSAATDTQSVPAVPTRLGAYVEADLGVLALFRGAGLFAGVSYGSWRAGAGFYRFHSPYRSLSGAPEGFDLSVEGIAHIEAAWHPLSTRIEGGYVKLIGQLKWQQVENIDNGSRRVLDSTLLGPELGWIFRVIEGAYLTPRVGALYYVDPPQGRSGDAVDVGGAPYDNPRHKTWDLYGTIGIGYAFD